MLDTVLHRDYRRERRDKAGSAVIVTDNEEVGARSVLLSLHEPRVADGVARTALVRECVAIGIQRLGNWTICLLPIGHSKTWGVIYEVPSTTKIGPVGLVLIVTAVRACAEAQPQTDKPRIINELMRFMKIKTTRFSALGAS